MLTPWRRRTEIFCSTRLANMPADRKLIRGEMTMTELHWFDLKEVPIKLPEIYIKTFPAWKPLSEKKKHNLLTTLNQHGSQTAQQAVGVKYRDVPLVNMSERREGGRGKDRMCMKIHLGCYTKGKRWPYLLVPAWIWRCRWTRHNYGSSSGHQSGQNMGEHWDWHTNIQNPHKMHNTNTPT